MKGSSEDREGGCYLKGEGAFAVLESNSLVKVDVDLSPECDAPRGLMLKWLEPNIHIYYIYIYKYITSPINSTFCASLYESVCFYASL